VLLFDAETGLPVCLMEAGWVTGLKTSASSAVTASYLARPGARTAAIFGAGLQGSLHAQALQHRFQLERIWLLDIVPETAQRAAGELSEALGISVQAAPLEKRQVVVQQADMIFTVTTGNQPLVEYDWLRPGTFLAKLGSYVEISPNVITRADKVVVDSWHYVSPRIPEIKALVREEKFGASYIHAEWPDIVGGRKPGRETDEEIIVYIALGIWGEYAAILPEVYRRALRLGLGQALPNSQVRKR
jgi:ornithine cyclodeaminase